MTRQGRRHDVDPPDDPKRMPNWWSPPGTEKRYCRACEHWFSSHGATVCPDCRDRLRREAARSLDL
jgi:uncharacterized paraquat-inducible protein A